MTGEINWSAKPEENIAAAKAKAAAATSEAGLTALERAYFRMLQTKRIANC